MTYKTIILRYTTDGYRETGQCLGSNLTEEEATQRAKDFNDGKPLNEGLGPQVPKDGGRFAVAVPDTLEE